RDRNRAEKLTHSSDAPALANVAERFSGDFAELSRQVERSVEDVHQKEQRYRQIVGSPDWQARRLACDLWTYAFFAPLRQETDGEQHVPTNAVLAQVLSRIGRTGIAGAGRFRRM